MIQTADLRVLGEQNPRLEHRHGDIAGTAWTGRFRCSPIGTHVHIALILVIGFAAVVFTYYGNLFFAGPHSYNGL